jgi:hypothetical protein
MDSTSGLSPWLPNECYIIHRLCTGLLSEHWTTEVNWIIVATGQSAGALAWRWPSPPLLTPSHSQGLARFFPLNRFSGCSATDSLFLGDCIPSGGTCSDRSGTLLSPASRMHMQALLSAQRSSSPSDGNDETGSSLSDLSARRMFDDGRPRKGKVLSPFHLTLLLIRIK